MGILLGELAEFLRVIGRQRIGTIDLVEKSHLAGECDPGQYGIILQSKTRLGIDV